MPSGPNSSNANTRSRSAWTSFATIGTRFPLAEVIRADAGLLVMETLMEEFSEAGVIPAEQPIASADPGGLPDVGVDLAALDADLAAADEDGQGTATPRGIE